MPIGPGPARVSRGVIWALRDGRTVVFNRSAVLAKASICIGAIEEQFDVARLEGQRPVVVVQSGGVVALVGKQVAALGERIGAAGIQGDGLIEVCTGLVAIAELLIDDAAVDIAPVSTGIC